MCCTGKALIIAVFNSALFQELRQRISQRHRKSYGKKFFSLHIFTVLKSKSATKLLNNLKSLLFLYKSFCRVSTKKYV